MKVTLQVTDHPLHGSTWSECSHMGYLEIAVIFYFITLLSSHVVFFIIATCKQFTKRGTEWPFAAIDEEEDRQIRGSPKKRIDFLARNLGFFLA